MKFYASIAAGVCMIWLGFEPDPDHSSDPGTGFGSGHFSSASCSFICSSLFCKPLVSVVNGSC